MIDTCNFWLPAFGAADPFQIAGFLDDVTERNSEKIGYSCTGTIGDYKAAIYQSGISLKGSLAKHFLPSNVYTLTRANVKEALEMLSDQIHTDITIAKPTRLDISTIIPTSRPPADYYSRLANKPYFVRLQATKDTLYYRTAKRQLAFYDKTLEAKAKGAIIPPALEGCNLLRYELRFTKRLQEQLKSPEQLTAAQLYQQDFYYRLVKIWEQEFNTIRKKHTMANILDNIKTPKEAANTLFGRLLLEAGGQSIADEFIADLKAANTFDDPKAYSRLKAQLNNLLQTPMEGREDIIKELEQAIKDIATYAR